MVYFGVFDDREGPPPYYQSVRGPAGFCRHRHASVIAASLCLEKRRHRDQRFWGRARFDWSIVGPGLQPLTTEENAILADWDTRMQESRNDFAPVPATVGFLRQIRTLSTDALRAAAERSVEQVAELLAEQRATLCPIHGRIAEDVLRVLGVRLHAATDEIVRQSVAYAALKSEAPLDRKGPKRAARRRRREEEAG